MKRWLLLLCILSTLQAADDTSWTWKDRDGGVQSRAELDRLLSEHIEWLQTGDKGKKINLSGADLSGADLSGVNLSDADLTRADLSGAILTRADLTQANLAGATLIGAHLAGAYLGGGDPDAIGAYLAKADFTRADLTSANFTRANLESADFAGATLTSADLGQADLKDANYEPKTDPDLDEIAKAQNLAYLTWGSKPEKVKTLKNDLNNAGYVEKARQVNRAIRRHDQKWYELLAFDWTCEWGANWLRPLKIVGVLTVLCALAYWIGMHFPKGGALYLVATGVPIAASNDKQRVFRIAIVRSGNASKTDHPDLDSGRSRRVWARSKALRRVLRPEVRALGTAFLFSCMSVFSIGFEGLDFRSWIRMLQPREFDIRARGWMRSVSGIQSLLGVALVALSLLSYFGHPFE